MRETPPWRLLKSHSLLIHLKCRVVLAALMIGQRNRDRLEVMVCGSIRDLLPDDHVRVRVDGVLDLSWLPCLVEGF